VGDVSDARSRPLREVDADGDPLVQFRLWFREAGEVVPVPEAVALATATPDGRPSARMVLMKQADEDGFVFHTGYESRKGRELTANPRAALLFHWAPLGRQVRIEGPVTQTSRSASEQYFRTRAPLSRVSALASPQSEVVSDRAELERRVEAALADYGDDPPLPERWGGFRLQPEVWEFWQHRENRLHDRLRYRRANGEWVIERLAP
jgi:pyridoxamine 5'-phosphate oxidase